MNIWIQASRPKTLSAALAPVVMGTAMAFGDRVFHPLAAGLALVCALLIQVATNFVNDYADFKKGADDGARIGPLRVTQAGLVTPEHMKRAIWMTFGLAMLLSLYLVYRGGWVIIVIGLLSIASGILYTEGPYPLGYHGLGDIFVLIFFGPVAVGGAYYVQALTINWMVIVAGFGSGLISVAILIVNNIRDVEGDRKSGKRTLAVRFGVGFAKREYFYCLLFSALTPVVIYLITGRYGWAMLAALTLVFSPGVLITVFSITEGPALNQALARTGKLLLVYGFLFSAGWIISARGLF